MLYNFAENIKFVAGVNVSVVDDGGTNVMVIVEHPDTKVSTQTLNFNKMALNAPNNVLAVPTTGLVTDIRFICNTDEVYMLDILYDTGLKVRYYSNDYVKYYIG